MGDPPAATPEIDVEIGDLLSLQLSPATLPKAKLLALQLPPAPHEAIKSTTAKDASHLQLRENF
jgi:hypothetical protein